MSYKDTDDGCRWVDDEELATPAASRTADLSNRFTYCAYCGERFEADKDANKVSNHFAACEKHPMRKLERQLAEARSVLHGISNTIKTYCADEYWQEAKGYCDLDALREAVAAAERLLGESDGLSPLPTE